MLPRLNKILNKSSTTLDLRIKSREIAPKKPYKKGQSQSGATQDNPSKLQENNGTTKIKKDTRKWCEFHKIPNHNTNECCAKQSMVVELKALEWCMSDSEPKLDKENDEGKQIIDVEPSAIVATTKVHKIDLEDPEEGGHLFHSHVWVKGSPL